MTRFVRGFVFLLLTCLAVQGQSLGNAGTIAGVVTDPSGALIAEADVTLTNSLSGYRQGVKSGADGAFRLVNIPPNTYRLVVTAPGFSLFSQDVPIRSSVAIELKAVHAEDSHGRIHSIGISRHMRRIHTTHIRQANQLQHLEISKETSALARPTTSLAYCH